MAALYPYISEGAHPGQAIAMKVHTLVWVEVGKGKLKTLSDFEVDIDGQVSVVVYKGDLRIHLLLLDQNKDAVAGPCRLQLNSYLDENASYKVEDECLTVSATIKDKAATVSLKRDNHGKQTKCVMTGYLDITAYLEADED